MDAGVNRKRRGVDRPVALDDLSVMPHANKVGCLDKAEMHSERIDPERVGEFRIPRRDVTNDTFIEAEFREQPKARGKPLFAMQAFLTNGCKHRRARQVGIHLFGGWCRVIEFLRCVHWDLLLGECATETTAGQQALTCPARAAGIDVSGSNRSHRQRNWSRLHQPNACSGMLHRPGPRMLWPIIILPSRSFVSLLPVGGHG